MRPLPRSSLAWVVSCLVTVHGQAQTVGYYRMPAIRGETIVFVAEGDLWKVGAGGGVATRLTSHSWQEVSPTISPDGTTLAFTARYEGPFELYTMPLAGGLPTRRTWYGDGAFATGWTPDGRLICRTAHDASLPDGQLLILDLRTGARTLVPLSQAADGSYDGSGRTLYFTRKAFQGSHTKRYQGGTAQQLWKYVEGSEAVPLTGDYPGTSKVPMWWQGRVYFASDRDGTMNLWSMDEEGSGLKQLTFHKGWDVQSPALGDGRIVYQLGADLRLFDITTGSDTLLAISLPSDFDQQRERWVRNPFDFLTAAHLAPKGDRVVLTARGQVFVAPSGQGRVVEATRAQAVRYRDARFLPDGKSLLALSTETGEVELARLPANGVGPSQILTHDGHVLRWQALPSPDGKWIAHHNKDWELWLLEVNTGKETRIATNPNDSFSDLTWSPDSRWLAFGASQNNQFRQLFLYDLRSRSTIPVTTDRYDSYSPAWSPDGKWVYFLSDRHFESLVTAPWGAREPEPYFDRQTEIFAVALTRGLRFPFQPVDELHPADTAKTTPSDSGKVGKQKPKSSQPAAAMPDSSVKVQIDTAGLAIRLYRVPAAAGNLSDLAVDGTRLYFLSWELGPKPKAALKSLTIGPKPPDPEVFLEDVKGYEQSLDRKKLLISKEKALYVVDAGAKPADLEKARVDLSGWAFPIVPREEWRQMFTEAWRLERDYFYDPGMHGAAWPAILPKYQPLVDRVTDRDELSDLLGQMVSELSALHIFVRGGDRPGGADTVAPASLGAELVRDSAAGGYRIAHIYRSDPDEPARLSPLARLGTVSDGDVIEAINGVSLLATPDPGVPLRNQAGRQVLLRLKPGAGGPSRDEIAIPISPGDAQDLRYREWEFTRRERVEREGKGRIGYVHLRAMGSGDIAQWARDFYPVFDREGLIIDVRHNRGGNIDSWILEKLLRKAWFYWQGRVGKPTWNMQYAFRGHLVVLCDESTASDGEAFTEGVRRLGLGKIIGTRTWGGEIWLTSSNVLVDRGIATAAEFGVYGPEGVWLIEGHGVDPDMVVDNLPHATFLGADAQLDTALGYLEEQIRTHPVPVPPAPRYPRKAAE
jgi:tricorn protease